MAKAMVQFPLGWDEVRYVFESHSRDRLEDSITRYDAKAGKIRVTLCDGLLAIGYGFTSSPAGAYGAWGEAIGNAQEALNHVENAEWLCETKFFINGEGPQTTGLPPEVSKVVCEHLLPHIPSWNR